MAGWKWSRRRTGRYRPRPKFLPRLGKPIVPWPRHPISALRRAADYLEWRRRLGSSSMIGASHLGERFARSHASLARDRFRRSTQVFHRAILVASAIFLAAGMSPALADCGGCGFQAPASTRRRSTRNRHRTMRNRSLSRRLFHRLASRTSADRGRSLGYWRLRYAWWLLRRLRRFWRPPRAGAVSASVFNGFGGCNCGRSVAYVPSPPYVVDQGPDYSGPGMFVPYGTYAPGAAYAPAINYPYVGPRYGYRAARLLSVSRLSRSTVRLPRARLRAPAPVFVPLTLSLGGEIGEGPLRAGLRFSRIFFRASQN